MFRSKQRLVFIKVESTYGSDPTPTIAIEAKNVKVGYAGEKLERDNVRSHIGSVQPVIGKRKIEVQFETELKGSGSLGVAPALADLFKACAYSENVSVGSSCTYSPKSQSQSSITLYVYDIPEAGSAVLHKITGARGSFKITGEAGKFAVVAWSMQGLYTAPTDVASPSDPTYESTLPQIVESLGFKLNDSSDLVVQKIELDIGNNIIERDDINSASSLKELAIISRKPTGSFNPEAVLAGTYAFHTDWIGATARAMEMTIGSVAGNKVKITAPKVTIDQISDSDRNGILTKDIPFQMSANAGNDEMVITFL